MACTQGAGSVRLFTAVMELQALACSVIIPVAWLAGTCSSTAGGGAYFKCREPVFLDFPACCVSSFVPFLAGTCSSFTMKASTVFQKPRWRATSPAGFVLGAVGLVVLLLYRPVAVEIPSCSVIYLSWRAEQVYSVRQNDPLSRCGTTSPSMLWCLAFSVWHSC